MTFIPPASSIRWPPRLFWVLMAVLCLAQIWPSARAYEAVDFAAAVAKPVTSAVATARPKKLTADQKMRIDLKAQESRNDGFHFDQSYDLHKEDQVNRLGLLLSDQSCTISPAPLDQPDATYYVIECPAKTPSVSVQIAQGAPFKDAVSESGRTRARKLSFTLSSSGSLSTERIQACTDSKKPGTCYPVQIDAKASTTVMPSALKLVAGRSATEITPVYVPKSKEYVITAFENEPLDITLQVNARDYADLQGLQAEKGFVNETTGLVFRPRGEQDRRVVYLTDKEHGTLQNVTVVTNTVPSYNPHLWDMRPSVGRLDPVFKPAHYAYYLRVPEGSKSTKVRLTAVDDVNTECSYVTDAGNTTSIVGKGVTSSLKLGPVYDPSVIIIECHHPNAPTHIIRYLLQTVQQKGGSTLLKSLDVIGGDIQQPFEPESKGLYTVNMLNSGANDQPWVSFRAIPQNKHARVDVEGYDVDATGHSPYFKVDLGETRQFRVGVRTPENPVTEVYTVAVTRPAQKDLSAKFADMLGWMATCASSTRAYHFLNNAHLLQWVSVTSRVPGMPESWIDYARKFNKFNWQWAKPDIVEFLGNSGQNKTPLKAVHNPNLDSEIYGDSDSFVAPPTPYGLIMNKFTLDSIPLALKWNGVQWVSTMSEVSAIALSISALEAEQLEALETAHALGLSNPSELADIENADFFNCANGDDCSTFVNDIDMPRVVRRLSVFSADEREALLEHLETSYRNTENVIEFSRSLATTSIALVVIAVVYIAVYFKFLRRPSGEMHRVYLRWLHPARFWLFVLDLACVSYAQACCGLAFSPLHDTEIRVLGIETTPGQLAYLCIGLMVLFPVLFVVVGTALLSMNSGALVFSKVFHKYHDQQIGEIKAFWQPLPFLPIIGRLFDVEISGVAPVLRPPQHNFVTSIILNEETRKETPWLEPDCRKALNLSGDLTTDPEASGLMRDNKPDFSGADLKHYKKLDAVKVHIDCDIDETQSDGWLRQRYDNLNAKVTATYPNAFLAWSKQPFTNLYSQQIQVDCAVLLKHMSSLVTSCAAEKFDVIAPRENLQLLSNDKLSNLIASCHKSNLFFWCFDRIAIVALVVAMSLSKDATGRTQMLAFAGASGLLLLIAIPGVLATSVSRYWQQMEADKRAMEKTNVYEAEDESKFQVWPFKDVRARAFFAQKMENESRFKESSPLWKMSNTLDRLTLQIVHNSFFKTRAAKMLGVFFTTYAFTEMMKLLVCITLLLGSRGVGGLRNGTATTLSIWMVCLAILCMNYEAFCMLFAQLRVFAYESYIETRRVFLFVKDCLSEPAQVGARLKFYVSQAAKAVFDRKNGNSFIFPGFQSEIVRDFTCYEVNVVNNEVGVLMPGVVAETNSNLRKMADEKNALAAARFGVQKTLFQAGTIGVFRSEIDRCLPVQIPFTQFCNGSADKESQLVATVQVVNHASLRYVPLHPHDAVDDSYLSLFTDPGLVPPSGKIRKSNLGHGYAVKIDNIYRRLTIKGPGILSGKYYSVKLTTNTPPGNPEYDLDSIASGSSKHKGNTSSAQCHCNTPGVLLVDVPVGSAPDLQEVITVTPPDAGEEPFEVDPAATHVVWDSQNRVMVIRSRGALLTSDVPYTVTWSVKQKGRHFTFSMDTPTKGRGLLLFLIADQNISIDSDTYIAIRDSDKSVTIDIDPKDTNAHEFSLSAVTTWHGPGGRLAAKHAVFNGEMDTLFSKHSIRATYVENIPCTVVQCVDPVARKYRVEPDFYEALRKVAARQEELLALRAQLQNLDCLPEVWYHVMSPADFVKFWASRGLDILDDGHRFVDPTREPDHPKVRTHGKIVREGELHLRMVLERRLQEQEVKLNALRNEYSIWLKAYSDSSELYTRQAELEEALTMSDFELAGVVQGQLKTMKSEYTRLLPHFVYPMIVEEKMINKAANWEAQFDKWDRQIDAWLAQEENASMVESLSGGMSCHDFTRLQIMHALRYTTRKPENLLMSRTKTVLHYVTSSRAVRGMDTQWRPDPLGAMFSYVRVWLEDARGNPDFRPESAVWRPCLVKLTGNAVKIMMPSSVDRNIQATYPWKRVSGWYIPLKCFERIECTYEPEDRMSTADNIVPPTMIGKLVFRRSLQIPVDDDFVKDIVTDDFNNWFNPDNPYEPCVVKERIMIGQSTNASEARNFPPQEYHSLGDNVSAYPLTFKLFPQDLERWRSVVWACGMYRPPRDVGDFIATRYREPPEDVDDHKRPSTSSSASHPELSSETSSVNSSYTTSHSSSYTSSESTVVEVKADEESERSPTTPTTPTPSTPVVKYPQDAFLGDFQNWRFHGDGKAKHPDDKHEVFEGGWKDGQRYGPDCHCEFKDNNNSRWIYDGGFWMDEFAGPGKIVLDKGDGVDKLKHSKDPKDRYCFVGFDGNFQLPSAKLPLRGNSMPYDDKPLLRSPELAKLFKGNYKLKKVGSHVSSSSSSSSNDDFDTRKILVLDDREAISACGDENVLSAPLKVIGAHFHDTRALLDGTPDDGGEFNELRSERSIKSLGDGKCDEDEFLCHAANWTRLIDPSLGFSTLGERLGKGTVIYADGCRFHKMDNKGLAANKPNGRGYFYCPRCPMKYDGHFKNGKPEGKGIMEFREGHDKVIFKGEFKDGERSGFGKQTCYDGKVYIEGHFANDRVSGGQAKVIVSDEKLIDKLGFSQYIGEMENGVPHGKGKLTFRPEREKTFVTYNGYFENGLRHGNGMMMDADGNLVLDGAWVNDMPQGRVTNYKLPDGKVYCGMLVKGELQGLGELFHAEGHSWIYEGAWFNNVPHGRGTLQTADGIYEGEFSRGKRDGKGTFKFNDGRRYEGDWKDDRPHGIGVYVDGAGGEFTYEFKDGKITRNSKKQYKTGGACSGSPNIADPVILECPINQHNPKHWGRQCFPKPENIRELSKFGEGMWAQHERHPMDYKDPSGLGRLPDRPVFITPASEGLGESDKDAPNMVMRIKVKRAENLPVKSTVGKMDPYCKVLLSYHQKLTKPHEKGHTDPVWEQTFKFRYTREKNLFFSIYNKNALSEDTPVAQTVFQLASWLDSGRTFEEFHVGLVSTDKKTGESVPAGTLVFGIELKELGEHENISEDSYASRNLHHEALPIHEMRFDAPEQRQISGTQQA